MPLSPGDKLGHYEILPLLGKGGMGEVYRARDSKLKRDVAIKVLPEALSRDAERMARFQREAEVLASLNHPNIAHIYGVEDHALVMELVEGSSPKGPLPFDEAWKIASQIAAALEYAHERGIIHRDLKPANILITPDGVVKLLDFGLAKAFTNRQEARTSDDPENSPTLTVGVTEAGVILGTAAYMPPEQAKGKTVDKRADIWAFGVVFYELLTGDRLFKGEHASDTLAQVLTKEPDLSKVPPQARRLLARCLEKDPKKRLRDIGEAAYLLEDAPSKPAPRGADKWLWTVVAAMAIVAGTSLWGWLHPSPPEPRNVVRFTTAVPVAAINGAMALSRDGSRLAYVSGPQNQIYVRMMDQLEAKPLPGTEDARFICFSPDGASLSFVTTKPERRIKKVAVAGGPVQILADAAVLTDFTTQDWGPDDNILVTTKGALIRLPSTGGKPQTLATPDPNQNEVAFEGAQLLPGGTHALVGITFRGKPPGRSGEIAAINLRTGERKTVVEHTTVAGRYLPTGPGSWGHIVYYAQASGSLMALRFDASRVEVKGSPAPVLDGVQNVLGPYGLWNISDSGTLAYVAGSPGPVAANTLVWVDRKGVEQPLPAPPRDYLPFSLSPDGQRVALLVPGERAEMWVYDIPRGTSLKIATDRPGGLPVWTPDGKRIIYNQEPRVLAWAPADNSGPPSVLADMEKGTPMPSSVSPDGKLVVGFYLPSEVLWALRLPEGPSGDAKPQSLVDSQPGKRDPHFSPDGRWVTYRSIETGVNEVYVAPYPGPGAKIPISTGGGATPRWSHDGRELFYRTQNPNQVLAVDVQTGPSFRAGTPKVLFEEKGAYLTFYEVSPDGKRFLMVKRPGTHSSASEVTVVLNWFEELRRRVPGTK